ncbi:MAG: hypothetical protein IPJ75_11600 [Ignavibacteriales bacterium]|nr:hypothetical protein [Ignavibacteriales bacterium]
MKTTLLFNRNFSVLAQDFIPHLDQLQQNVIDKMRNNKIKRMEAVSYQTDANFKPLSEKFYYAYSYDYDELGKITRVDYFNIEQDMGVETTYAYDANGTIESIVVIETSGLCKVRLFLPPLLFGQLLLMV